MIVDNIIFWQGVVFAVWGYVSSWVIFSITAVPSRLLETS